MSDNHHKNILWTATETPLPEELWHRLEEMGYKVLMCESGEPFSDMIRKISPCLWIGEAETLSDADFSIFQAVKRDYPDLPVILLSSRPDIEEAVNAVKMGVTDYMRNNISHERLWASIEGALGSRGIRKTSQPQEVKTKKFARRPIALHPSMVKVLNLAKRIAPSRSTVLIQGESGTGKEVIARYIHEYSNRSDRPFVAVNCAALPENLLESELFGHEKGAFTGAVTRKKGKFELASGGTLLLDEISEMAVSIQAKLLRVLQEREIDRLGGQYTVPVDTRVISTTNRDLETETKNGNFRLDLFYRLNVVPIHLPPLRNRPEDIACLAEAFLKNHAAFNNFPVKTLSKEAETFLQKRAWPGNVRELENLMERAILLVESDVISPGDLENISLSEQAMPGPSAGEGAGGTLTLKDVEKKMIFKALDSHEGNRTHAAKVLGISVRTLRNKLHEYKNEFEEEAIRSHG
ncbi:MAG: sigma-54 dependent transcriptional regulator [Pseudomonadota bacterium]